jgi:hypothetical protein
MTWPNMGILCGVRLELMQHYACLRDSALSSETYGGDDGAYAGGQPGRRRRGPGGQHSVPGHAEQVRRRYRHAHLAQHPVRAWALALIRARRAGGVGRVFLDPCSQSSPKSVARALKPSAEPAGVPCAIRPRSRPNIVRTSASIPSLRALVQPERYGNHASTTACWPSDE